MEVSCTQGLAHNIREELWSYFALSGLLFLNIGIVLVVYALKHASPYPVVVEVFGLALIVLGVLSTLASWYVHRQHRRKKPICTCASLCCQKPPGVMNEESRLASQSTSCNSNVYVTRHSLVDGKASKNAKQKPQRASKMYSTPEFQKYAEYMERDTAGVEINGTGKFKVESLRQKKHVHPQPPPGMPQAALLINAMYTQKGNVISQPVTVSSPILLALSQ